MTFDIKQYITEARGPQAAKKLAVARKVMGDLHRKVLESIKSLPVTMKDRDNKELMAMLKLLQNTGNRLRQYS